MSLPMVKAFAPRVSAADAAASSVCTRTWLKSTPRRFSKKTRSVSGIDIAPIGGSSVLLWPIAFAGEIIVLLLVIVAAFLIHFAAAASAALAAFSSFAFLV